MHVLIHCLIALVTAGLLTQLAIALMPVGTPRQIVLICIAAGAGVFCLNRLAQAAPYALEGTHKPSMFVGGPK